MNCPMCGAPLGDNEFECSKCFTKRSEMGPAYNNNGSNGYGNNYGGNGYGNSGYQNNNGYGTSYNTSYGSTNNYGSSNGLGGTGNYDGMGYSSTGVKTGSRNQVITIILVIVFVLTAGYVLFIKPSMFKSFDMGDFSVSLPSNCTASNSTDLDLSEMGDAKAYKNRDMEFAYLHIDLASMGIGSDQMGLFNTLLMSQIDTTFNSMYNGYMNLGQTDDMVKFKFINDNNVTAYVEMKMIYENDGVYMVICICDEGDRSKMEEKFTRVFNSIKFK